MKEIKFSKENLIFKTILNFQEKINFQKKNSQQVFLLSQFIISSSLFSHLHLNPFRPSEIHFGSCYMTPSDVDHLSLSVTCLHRETCSYCETCSDACGNPFLPATCFDWATWSRATCCDYALACSCYDCLTSACCRTFVCYDRDCWSVTSNDWNTKTNRWIKHIQGKEWKQCLIHIQKQRPVTCHQVQH